MLKVNKKHILPIFVMSLMMTSKVFLNSVNSEYKYYVAIIWILIHTVEHRSWIFSRSKSDLISGGIVRKIYMQIGFPYLFAALYSVFLLIIGNTTTHYLWRGISYALHIIVCFVFSYVFLDRYRENSFKIIGAAALLSYFYTLVFAFIGLGFSGSLAYIVRPGSFSTTISAWFEMHDLVFSVGFLLIYILLGYNGKIRNHIGQLILLVFVFYVGYKRIAILGLIASVLISVIISNRARTRSIQVGKIIAILLGVLGLCYVYTFMLSTGAFEALMLKYNINLMGRDRIYTYFRSFYDYSFGFLGNGYGFTAQYLLDNSSSLVRQLHGTLGLHNDILRLYIELGIWGSLIWHFWYLIRIPNSLKTYDFSCLKLFMAFMIYAYIVYLTDNTTTYFWFQFMWSVLLGHHIIKQSIPKEPSEVIGR